MGCSLAEQWLEQRDGEAEATIAAAKEKHKDVDKV
jgi:hypothetical protein